VNFFTCRSPANSTAFHVLRSCIAPSVASYVVECAFTGGFESLPLRQIPQHKRLNTSLRSATPTKNLILENTWRTNSLSCDCVERGCQERSIAIQFVPFVSGHSGNLLIRRRLACKIHPKTALVSPNFSPNLSHPVPTDAESIENRLIGSVLRAKTGTLIAFRMVIGTITPNVEAFDLPPIFSPGMMRLSPQG
jgi:hypothetical protein